MWRSRFGPVCVDWVRFVGVVAWGTATAGCGATDGSAGEPLPSWIFAGAGGGATATSGGREAGGGGGAAVGSGGAGLEPRVPARGPGPVDIREVWPSEGCGKSYDGPSANLAITLPTMGKKDQDCAAKTAEGKPRCGLWGQVGSTWQPVPLPREHHVFLPQNYDSTKPYPLVFLAPACGGKGTDIFTLSDGLTPSVGNTAIRIGLTPAGNIVGHGTNPDQGCFDDKEGDDSVDWVHYEVLYDYLNQQLCFDRHRVFAVGNHSGAWLTNELGCKYAGDAVRPIRGVIPVSGGLPADPAHVPACTTSPMAGLWVHQVSDPVQPFEDAKRAIARAMSVNRCTMGSGYDDATFADFPIGGGNANSTCQRIVGCDALYPLVVCPLPRNGRSANEGVVNPGASTFIKMFLQDGFIAP